ncbi:uncharacterized protein [Magallana gigas]|uniref:uncharacterized protein isoform X10 n=1 Tax=Magallana gigas TaxID=29159 RepID=UPI003342B1E9
MDAPGSLLFPYFTPKKAMDNYLRLCYLITSLCGDLFRDILSRYIKPADLRSELDKNKQKLEKILNKQQQNLIYPATGNTSLTTKDCDISILYILLRSICNIPSHKAGWGKPPAIDDNSIAAGIEKIRLTRNLILVHSTNEMEDPVFEKHWNDLRDVVVQIETQLTGSDFYKRGVDFLHSCNLTSVRTEADHNEGKSKQEFGWNIYFNPKYFNREDENMPFQEEKSTVSPSQHSLSDLEIMDAPGSLLAPCFTPMKAIDNYLRLCCLITSLCGDLFRDILSRYIKPADLRSELDKNRQKLEKMLNKQQQNLIYPATGNISLTTKDCDISILYILLRSICNIPSHKAGWGNPPAIGDNSIAAGIEKIRLTRNLILVHSTNGMIEDPVFEKHWNDLRDVVVQIETQLTGSDLYKRGVDFLHSCNFTSVRTEADHNEGKSKQAFGWNIYFNPKYFNREDENMPFQEEKSTVSPSQHSLSGKHSQDNDLEIMDAPGSLLAPCFTPKKAIDNYLRLCYLITSLCGDLFRDILSRYIKPADLRSELDKNRQKLEKILNKQQQNLIYPATGNTSLTTKDCDISILYILLRSICNIPSHKAGWGNPPAIDDNSIAAGIEKIRLTRNLILVHSTNEMEDPVFEKHWNDLRDVVVQIETQLTGSDFYKRGVDFLHSCNLTSVGTEADHNEGKKFGWNIYFNPKYFNREDENMPFQEEKSTVSPSQHSLSDTYRFEPIQSEKLKELLNSFKVEFPDDLSCESFIHQILQDDMLKKLVTAVKSLSKGIMLTKNINERRHAMPTVGACVFEVDVVFDGDQFSVIRKNASSNDFFNVNEEYLTRVILIKSKSLPVVDAKLLVYKKYKHVINRRKIVLQHEYEEFDDVAKCIAYQILSSFCTFVESVINAFTMDLHTIISDYPVESLTVEKIKRLCKEVFERIEDETIGAFESKSDWRRWVADEIGRIIRRKGEPVCSDAWVEIKNISQKTVKDLNAILTELEEFQTCVLPVDQNKQVEEWLKRDVILDKSVFKMHPSIIKYITGYKDRDDKKQVVKVYLHGDDKKAENFFKECCKISTDTYFEFVNVERSKGGNKEVEELKQRERKAPVVDDSTRKQLKQIIQEYGDKIYARHSNVVGIRIGKARRVGDTIQEQPCLVLYCLDKFLVPFGEKPLPEAIAGWPCDIREDFVRFGICPDRCLASSQNLPDPGCSIGIPSHDSSGSVGFLIESKDPLHTFEFGFLTASHVAVKRFEQLYHDEKLLSMHYLKLNDHFIVHPSWIDNGRNDHRIGKVVESFCGNYGLNKIGLDFAVIASSYCRNGAGKETLKVAKKDDLNIEKDIVTKTGRTTGKTNGYLMDDSLTVKVDRSFLSRGYFAFFNCYAIEDIPDDQPEEEEILVLAFT